jgi:hypothetical protein
VARPDGTRHNAGDGSNRNVAEHGLAEEAGRAALWENHRARGAAGV